MPAIATSPRLTNSTRRSGTSDLEVPRKRRKAPSARVAAGPVESSDDGDTLLDTRARTDDGAAATVEEATTTIDPDTDVVTEPAPSAVDTAADKSNTTTDEDESTTGDVGADDTSADDGDTLADEANADETAETPSAAPLPSKASAGAEQIDIRPSTTRVNQPVTAAARRSEPLIIPALIQLALGLVSLAAIAGFAADVVLASDVSLLGTFGLLERMQQVADAVSFAILPLTAVTGVLSLLLLIPWLRGLRGDNHDWVEPAVPGIATWAAATGGAYFVQRRVLGGDGAASWMNDDLIMSSLFFHGIVLIGAVIGALAVGQIKDAYLDRRRFVTPGQKI